MSATEFVNAAFQVLDKDSLSVILQFMQPNDIVKFCETSDVCKSIDWRAMIFYFYGNELDLKTYSFDVFRELTMSPIKSYNLNWPQKGDYLDPNTFKGNRKLYPTLSQRNNNDITVNVKILSTQSITYWILVKWDLDLVDGYAHSYYKYNDLLEAAISYFMHSALGQINIPEVFSEIEIRTAATKANLNNELLNEVLNGNEDLLLEDINEFIKILFKIPTKEELGKQFNYGQGSYRFDLTEEVISVARLKFPPSK